MPSKPQDNGEAGGLRLLLLRHAKSAWPEGVADEQRPLNGRGRTAARLVGDYLAEAKLIPDLALVSTARRTQETWALVRERLPLKPEMRGVAELYAASPGQILDVLQAVEPAARTVLILAHNPGMQDLGLALTGGGDAASRESMAAKYPTAGLAVIDFPAARWRDVGRGMGRLERFVTPKALQ
ncbi:SixA phosphatase family protein [Ciceribacter selenitireducens]